MESGYSLADIAAATGNGNNRNGDGMWGDWIWIIVLFLFAGGGWGNGFGGNGANGSGLQHCIHNQMHMDMAPEPYKPVQAVADEAVQRWCCQLHQ